MAAASQRASLALGRAAISARIKVRRRFAGVVVCPEAEMSLRMIRSIRAAPLVAGALFGAGGAGAQTAVLYGLIDASGSYVQPVGGDEHAAAARPTATCSAATSAFAAARTSAAACARCIGSSPTCASTPARPAASSATPSGRARRASASRARSARPSSAARRRRSGWRSRRSIPFGESFGFSPTVRQYFGGAMLGDTRWNNSVWYTNNPRDPLRVSLRRQRRRDDAGRLDRPQPGAQRLLRHRPVRGHHRRRDDPATAASRCRRDSTARP